MTSEADASCRGCPCGRGGWDLEAAILKAELAVADTTAADTAAGITKVGMRPDQAGQLVWGLVLPLILGQRPAAP